MRRLALLPSEGVQHVSRSEELGPRLLVVGSTEVLGLVVGVVADAFPPVVLKLLLVFFVSQISVVHIRRFGCFWVEIFCNET